MTRIACWAVAFGAFICLPCLAMAQDQSAPISATEQAKLRLEQAVLSEPGVAEAHSDLFYRGLGADAYRQGDKKRALSLLLQSSRYGDKASQAMVAAMYWNGDGVEVDHARAYAWMDLAADRGYRDLAIQRELYWSRLSEAERAQALKIGQDVYAEYSDEQGQHRLERELSRESLKVTGSHAGFAGNGFVAHSFSSLMSMDAHLHNFRDTDAELFQLGDYYSDAVWKTNEYLHVKDLQWSLKGPLQGNVNVGELGPVRPAADTQPPG